MGKPHRREQTVHAKDSVPPQQSSCDEAKEWDTVRMAMNLAQTGHPEPRPDRIPLHHETADGTIVDADPTLEQLMTHVAPRLLLRLAQQQLEPHPGAVDD